MKTKNLKQIEINFQEETINIKKEASIMPRKVFKRNDTVKINTTAKTPTRYHGRKAQVIYDFGDGRVVLKSPMADRSKNLFVSQDSLERVIK
jgi:hypothetical protein